ncbi:MAG: RNA polymerase sigma factor [Desulfobacteraceae bacterium]|jgi:RNA polymerase sigma-70 factor (ECF subfamily)|nr:RNA polymerase sigma factor [Desulfobacteraceae bacterium]
MEFDEIYEEFQPKILNYLARLVGPNEAEDMAQVVFARVSRGLGSFKGQSKLSTWVYRIATNTAIDKLRSPAHSLESGRSSLEESAAVANNTPTIPPADTPTDQKVIRKEMSECVREYVDRLPPEHRTVLVLSELEEFKNREIADILQITLENVKVRLHRAKARLKQELDEGCDFYHTEEGTLACDRKPIHIKSKKPD